MTAPLPTGVDGTPVDMTSAWGAASISPFGGLSAVTNITTTLLDLSDDESTLVNLLESWVTSRRFSLELRDAYYKGIVRVQDLGISIPPQMRNLHTTVGWPRVACDAIDRRLNIDGFRYPDAPDIDDTLQQIWLANDLDSEHSLSNLDSLVFGCGYVGVGSAPSGPNVLDAPPLITVESPLDMAVQWDARRRTIAAALRLYGFEGSWQGTLYLPDQTISLIKTNMGWQVADRDIHRLGQCLIVRLPNRARSYDRDGASEITPEIMALTDAACRTLARLAVAGEFYSAPQRYILGAQESAFQNADGTQKSAWETYLGRIVALEADEDGNVPTVGQFTAYNPSVFTAEIDSYAQRMSSLTGLPPHVLGFATANPTSADAIRSSEMELTRRADHKTVALGKGWRDVMKLALLVQNGTLPANAEKLTTVWSSTATPTIAATTDAIFKQVTMGYLPAESDVTGELLGYSSAQRARIEADRATDAGMSFLDEVAHSIGAKDARVDQSLAAVIGGKGASAPSNPIPVPPTPDPSAAPPA